MTAFARAAAAQLLHPCAVAGCAGRAKSGHLMCREHWFRLPPGLRVEVADAWRGLRRCTSSTSAVDAAARYRFARRDAIDFFTDQQRQGATP